MANQQPQNPNWRGRLQIWLRTVATEAAMFGGNFQAAVNNHAHEFPSSRFYSAIRKYLTAEIAKWFLKQAISDVSQAANLNLTPEAIDTIADLAVPFL
jgi:hypothetical protein